MDVTIVTPVVNTAPLEVWHRSLLAEWRAERMILALILPGFACFLVFHYIPLLGYVIAFEDYLPFLGFCASPWVGFQNFANLFGDRNFWAAVQNTLVFAALQLVLFFPAPTVLALLVNSLLSTRIRRFVQSVVRTYPTSSAGRSSSRSFNQQISRNSLHRR